MKGSKKTLPNISTLLKLEKKSRVEGSGIKAESLIGVWEFKSVWKQGSNNEDLISSTMLQILSANLVLKEDQKKENEANFLIANSITFGLLSLIFTGTANLERKQPLLSFSFDFIKIQIASSTILKRSLPTPNQKQKPFFALIAIDSEGKWLSARGKGGGLALWERG